MKGGFGGSSDYNDVKDAERRYGAPPNKKTSSSTSYLAPKTTIAKTVEHTPSPDFKESDTSKLQVGQKVEHQKFGFGEVTKLEGAAHNPIATVKFDHNGEKKIMLNYAKLRILS
jgi:DNA helicase-2/ATP-dependent DNA helicase PcrA